MKDLIVRDRVDIRFDNVNKCSTQASTISYFPPQPNKQQDIFKNLLIFPLTARNGGNCKKNHLICILINPRVTLIQVKTSQPINCRTFNTSQPLFHSLPFLHLHLLRLYANSCYLLQIAISTTYLTRTGTSDFFKPASGADNSQKNTCPIEKSSS